MKAWYDDIDSATLQRIKTYSAFNDATSKNLMVQTMYEYREKEIQDFKETNHELAETCIARKKRIEELEKENAELKETCNKANEWHKQEVDDIYDLISKDWSIRYFICIMKDKSRITAIGNCDEGCNGEVSVNLFFEHDDEKYYIDDIAWWKEIVFPEEEKEND